jgi:hypothetical protein
VLRSTHNKLIKGLMSTGFERGILVNVYNSSYQKQQSRTDQKQHPFIYYFCFAYGTR